MTVVPKINLDNIMLIIVINQIGSSIIERRVRDKLNNDITNYRCDIEGSLRLSK